MYKTCSYFVVCDFFTTVHDPQKSKNAEIPKSKQKQKQKTKTENHLDKRYPLHNLSTYRCNVTSKFLC